MSKIILDFGSGNTCKNSWDYAKRMIDELYAVDTGKHEVIIKWQLFKEAGQNIPLHKSIFDLAYVYADKLGYKTTSSVFDKESLDFLLQFDVPFVKISANISNSNLIYYTPIENEVYKSLRSSEYINHFYEHFDSFHHPVLLCCVSKYPTTIEEYEDKFLIKHLKRAISDHTTNWDLFNKYKPEIIEVHYGLEDSAGLDAGPFMRTPAMLAEVL